MGSMTPSGLEISSDKHSLAAAFDRVALVERCAGNQALARELASLFLGNVDQMVTAVAQAIESGDAFALERSAHGLKGMVANFGAATAVARAAEIERLGRSRAPEKVVKSMEEKLAERTAEHQKLGDRLAQLEKSQ